MYRVLLIAASAVVGAVAGYFGPKLIDYCRPGSSMLLPFPTSRTQRPTRRGPVAGLQPSSNGPDGVDHDDR
ncbi:MAG: hypothetical protein JNM56_32540 [Planctomycetia bacterium]|nr:hypothetical protein [Planctomycetia bacterium]